MDLLKATPELFAEYLDFLVRFSCAPVQVLERYTPDDGAQNRPINGKLLLFALLGVGSALVIAAIGRALGMAQDNSTILKVLGRFDEKILPIAVLLGIVIAGVALHILTKVGARVGGFYGAERSAGSLQDTLNAAMGFASWFVPTVTVALVVIRLIAAAQASTFSIAIFIAISVCLSLAFLIYLAGAFAGAHRIPFRRAFILLMLTFAFSSFVVDLLT